MKFPYCPACKTKFSKQLHRNFVLKVMLPWVPLRQFYCGTCDTAYYKFVPLSYKR